PSNRGCLPCKDRMANDVAALPAEGAGAVAPLGRSLCLVLTAPRSTEGGSDRHRGAAKATRSTSPHQGTRGQQGEKCIPHPRRSLGCCPVCTPEALAVC